MVVLPTCIYVASYIVNHILVFDREDSEELKYGAERLVYGHSNALNSIAHYNGILYTASLDKSVRMWGKKVGIKFKLKVEFI
jgi:hypothetical protein